MLLTSCVSEDLRNSQLDAVLRTVLDAAVVMRTDGTVAGWNRAAEQIFGWSFAEAEGRSMAGLIIPPEQRAAHTAGLAQWRKTGAGPVLNNRIEVTARLRNGTLIPVELSVTPTHANGTTVFVGFLRDITQRRQELEHQKLVAREMHHRVKNLLAVVCGVANLTSRNAQSAEQFSADFTGRLQALAKTHGLLADGDWHSADLRELAVAVLADYMNAPAPRITLDGPAVLLSPRRAVAVNMILYELLTNSVKYGALRDHGSVAVSWRLHGGRAELEWREQGALDVKPPARAGFGSRMISANVRGELRGTESYDWRAGGLLWRAEWTQTQS